MDHHFTRLGIFITLVIVSLNTIAGQHGIAMHGTVKYPSDFTHFDYTNPDAPKGGDVRLSAIGTYDSLNPFILKGQAPSGIGRLFDTLTTGSDDEAFSQYGLLASDIEIADDRSWVIFTLRPEARFHDGKQVTADDVAFTVELLKSKGHPFYRSYYADIQSVEVLEGNRARFVFTSGDNRELPLIVGQIPVLPKHWWQNRDFAKTTLEPPLGSGPYRIKTLDAGRSITYERVADYWGKDLAVNRGRHNFDTIRVDYYRDATVALQAFKAGEYDFRNENISKNWATAYDIPAVSDGELIKQEIRHEQATGMQCFVFNTRRAMFSEPTVRQAISYAFDFEWANRNLFYDSYTRNDSYFSNSELASSGKPSKEELAILTPYRGKIPDAVFNQAYTPPVTNGSGNIRQNLRKAIRLLKQAGWSVKNGKLTHQATGQVMTFEILLVSPSFERVVLPFKKNLARLGIDVSVRTVDSTQYQNRIDAFDFDMVVHSFGQSLSPGNEQRDLWGSAQADRKGSRNMAGIKDPVVDELVELVINAPDRTSLINRTRALDRVLLHGHYVIPHWHIRNFRVAYWNKFGRPAISPKYALGFDTWWVK